MSETMELEFKVKNSVVAEIKKTEAAFISLDKTWEEIKKQPLVINSEFEKMINKSTKLGTTTKELSTTTKNFSDNYTRSMNEVKKSATSMASTIQQSSKVVEDATEAEIAAALKLRRERGRGLTETERAIQKEKEASESSTALGRQLKNLAGSWDVVKVAVASTVGALGAMAVLRSTVQFLKDSRKESQAFKEEQFQLKAAIGFTSIELKNQTQELQNKLFIDDSIIAKTQVKLAAYVKEEQAIKRLIPVVADIAAVTGMDLGAAADLVGKSIGSTTNALTRYGVSVQGAAGSVERLNSLIESSNKLYGGQAEAAAESKDVIDRLSIAWKNLQQAVGDSMRGEGSKAYFEESQRQWKKYHENVLANQDKFNKETVANSMLWIENFRKSAEEQARRKSVFSTTMEANANAAKATMEKTEELQIKLWEKTDTGRILLLKKRMAEELAEVQGNSVQRKLIEDRYAIEIKAIEDGIASRREAALKKQQSEQESFNKWLSTQLDSVAKENERREKETLKTVSDAKTAYYEAQFALIEDEYLREQSLLQLKMSGELAAAKDNEEAKFYIREKYRLLSRGLEIKDQKNTEEKNKKDLKEEEKLAKEKIDNIQTVTNMSINTFSQIAKAAKAGSAVQKGIDIAQATANTAIAVTKAMASGQAWMIPFYIAMGTAQVALIAQQKYAGGGIVGGGSPNQGDSVPALLTPGEMILNQQQQNNLFQTLNGRPGITNNNNSAIHLNINVSSGGNYDMNAARYTVDSLTPILGDALVKAKLEGRLRDYEATR